MNGYYDIHCPYCGGIIQPNNVKFSISEFVAEIYNQSLQDTFNDGIVGVIDEDEINLILDNDFLWDMSVQDVECCYFEGMFVLGGRNLVKRFGARVMEIFENITKEEIDSVAQSSNVDEMLKSNENNVAVLVREILKKVPRERLIRSEVSAEERNVAVLNLLSYAKTTKTLFKIHLSVEIDTDDRGNRFPKDIRSDDGRVICRSKRCCNCGNELSKMAGKYEEKIISFIGSPAAGKSAYLAASISKLLKSGQSEYGIEVVFDYQSADYIAFNESCLMPYTNGFAITKTNQGTFPQLSMALRNLYTQKTFLYTFVDIPGETFIDENGCNVSDLLANRRIIQHADVVWFCVSAKQLFASKVSSVKAKKRNDATIENEEMRNLSVLGANTIEFANNMFPEGHKRPAVALILTKSDLLSNFIMENVFGNGENDINIKNDYFKRICSCPQNSNNAQRELFDYYDGEPNTMGQIYHGRLIWEKFINDSKQISGFIREYGDSYTSAFMGNVASAFKKRTCVCFSQASYGRDSIEQFSTEAAIKFLLKNKDRLKAEEYEDVVDILGGESVVDAYEKGKGKIPPIRRKSDIEAIHEKYRRLNQIYPFAIMSPLMWTFAYTGFIECVENNGVKWNLVPTYGPAFNLLQSRLTMDTEGGPVVTMDMVKPPVKRKLFGRH